MTKPIGYGKPPRGRPFKKGKSGNPAGRPKGSKNLSTLLAEISAERIPITENGKGKTITKLQAAMKQLVNKAAATGDLKYLRQLFQMTQWSEGHGEIRDHR